MSDAEIITQLLELFFKDEICVYVDCLCFVTTQKSHVINKI